jgi:hypothetical protein
MRPILLAFVSVLLVGVPCLAQTSCPQEAAKHLVEKLWDSAAKGELLTPEGLAKASPLFTKANTATQETTIRIVSDYYGVNAYKIDGTTAAVDMEFTDAGQIDQYLNYSEAKLTPGIKTSIRYSLISGPAYASTYGADGKTLVSRREVPGAVAWRIDGAPPNPWTTVNGAIRYLLEARNKANDSALRKNAETSITKLLRFH